MRSLQGLKDFARAAPLLARPGTVVLRRFSRALGDNLMLSHLAREWKRCRPGSRVVLETNWPELFQGNPNVDLAVRSKVALRYRRPGYRIERETRTHILDQLAESVGLPPTAERRVEMFLTPAEVEAATRGLPQPYVAVCPVGKRTVAGNRKDWGVERFQAVVDQCPGVDFVQIGSPADPLLRGVADRRGLPIRVSAAVLAGARRALVLEGGLMHLAQAVGTPAVVIYGGTVAPEVSAYPEHTNLVVRAPCGPCFRSHGRLEDCRTMACMQRISPGLVCDLVCTNRRGTVEVAW